MSKALGLEREGQRQPLRRLDVWRDLEQVSRLLSLVFGDESAAHGRSVSREFDLLRFAAPVASLHGLFSESFAGVFSGFVWEENGRIVGNVSVGKVNGTGQRWMIANVAVHPTHRRRGIARHLTQAAIDEAARRGAQVIVLDVRAENEAARCLYSSMAFRFIDRKARFRLDHATRHDWAVPAGCEIWQISPHERHRLLPLAMAATPRAVQEIMPLQTRYYSAPWWRRALKGLTHALAGEVERTFGVVKDTDLVGAAEIMARKWGPAHRLSLLTHPDCAEQIAGTLVGRSLASLRYYVSRPVLAETHSCRRAETEALLSYGFVELESLETMIRTL